MPQCQSLSGNSFVYRVLKAEDLITAPAHFVIRVADETKDKICKHSSFTAPEMSLWFFRKQGADRDETIVQYPR